MTIDRGQFSGLVEGAPVVAMDGEQLGTVKEVRGRHFKVDAPMAPDYWLSVDSVNSGSGGQVVLRFNKDQVGDFQVGEPDEMDADAGRMTDYRATDVAATAGTMPARASDADHDHSAGIGDHTHMGERAGDRPSHMPGQTRMTDASHTAGAMTGSSTTGTTTDQASRAGDYRTDETDDQRTLRLREERLGAEKRTVEAGEVGLRKEVTSEQQSIDVPVRREEVYIERRPASGQTTGGEIGEDEAIRVPVREEEVRATKETVVTGEVAIGKRAVEDSERVTGEVRREEARLETQGDVDVSGSAGNTTMREGQDRDRR
jgi:uncharacterized protein (TIGR02271 family)